MLKGRMLRRAGVSGWGMGLLLLLLGLLCLPRPLWAGQGTTGQQAVPPVPGEVTELWEGEVLTSRFRAAVCINARGELRGAALLRTRGGQVDVYHLEGNVREGRVEARHPSSGHYFTGRLMDDGKAGGTLRLKSGLSFAIEARRTPDVPVTEDCAPVPVDGWRVRKE